MLMTKEQERAKEKIVNGFVDALVFECKTRCPGNNGYEPKCEYCEVQRILRKAKMEFEIVAERAGLLHAIRCLVENEHRERMSGWE